MKFDKQQGRPVISFRQEKFHRSTHRRRHHTQSFTTADVASERYILQNRYVPAIERDGFWRGCWAGFAVLDSRGRREFLSDKKLRRAMRRLIDRGAFGSLIDVHEQHKRDAFDREMLLTERHERRQYGRTR